MASAIFTFGFLLVLCVTLYPFDFFFANVSFLEITNRFDFRFVTPYVADLLNNILLFLPIGFSVAAMMRKRKLGEPAVFLMAVAAGFGLSFAVEVLQVFLPDRFPAVSDVVSNSAGAGFGYLCFRRWGEAIIDRITTLISKIFLSRANVAIGFISYLALIFVASALWQNTIALSNWEQGFPLVIGNEATGNRPWRGEVFEVAIADRAFDREEIARIFSQRESNALVTGSFLASYRFIGEDNYDQIERPPKLAWQGAGPQIKLARGVSLAVGRWLQTTSPADFLTQMIRSTSEFTLIATVATSDFDQSGPARIVSISQDYGRRNFTLGQSGADLIVRLRTPLTGENGVNPEFAFPDVFADSNPHQLILTYDPPMLRLYVDDIKRSYHVSLSPGFGLYQFLFPINGWRVRLDAINVAGVCEMLFYGVVFIPVGLFVALMSIIVKGRLLYRSLLICGGIILPAVVLESMLGNGDTFRLANAAATVVIATCATLLFRVWAVNSLLPEAKSVFQSGRATAQRTSSTD
jgi:glycopeptide antibiotics resistance protein